MMLIQSHCTVCGVRLSSVVTKDGDVLPWRDRQGRDKHVDYSAISAPFQTMPFAPHVPGQVTHFGTSVVLTHPAVRV